MKYSIDKQEYFNLLTIQEENLNSVYAPEFKSDLVVMKNEGVKNLIINLEKVKFVDSSGLSAILTAHRLWSEDGSFVLTGVAHPSVKTLINISRLNSVLNIVPTTQEAIDYVMMEALEREIEGESEEEED